jgi:hypothetical protein
MKKIKKMIFVLSVLLVCTSVIAKDKKKSDSLTYKGAWFEIDYPKILQSSLRFLPRLRIYMIALILFLRIRKLLFMFSLLSGQAMQQTLASTRIRKLKKIQEQKVRMDLSINGIPMKVKMVLNCVPIRKQPMQRRQLS